ARGTRLFDHISLELVAHAVRGGLAVALLDVLEDAGPARLVRAVPALAVVLIGERAARRALQEALLHDRGEILPWRVEVELVRPGQRRQHHLAQVPARLAPREDHALEDRQTGIAEHQVGVDLATRAQPRAVRTCP